MFANGGQEFNAWVYPNGQIFVNTGLLDECDTEDQFAMVLGHEISHAVLGHGGEKITRGYLAQIALVLPLALLWSIVPSDGIAFITHWFLGIMPKHIGYRFMLISHP